MEFKQKFVGFVDILGWKEKVRRAETGTGMSLTELLEAAKDLGTPADKGRIEKYGPMICPRSNYILRNLDFQLTRISDCVVVSSEISPVGVINLVNHCWGAVIKLLTKGIMCRGYITRGQIYHTDNEIIGTGYQEALDKEHNVSAFKREADERGTPFVEIDPSVCDYVKECGDACVKEMFSRYVNHDGSMTALFPFQRLQHSFIVGDCLGHTFDPDKERRSNENMRSMIQQTKERVIAALDQSRPDAVGKAQHYVAALDAQLEVCKKLDKEIEMLRDAFRKRTGK
jgi:hypothetical protein